VTTGKTALQKVQRAFAQEFLCPFSALDRYTEENGLDEDGISDAAEYFGVSPLLVATTLVNNKKLPRHRLQAVLG
jgi:Zn-dependent peptidase ImmA (M78 family)